MAFVNVRHFSYTYPGADRPALRDVNLDIEQGAFVVVTGKSGCGKSTLGKALAGYLFQDESPTYFGEIMVNGVAMDHVPLYAASERVAYVQQNPEDQFCTLTVLDEIAFGLENRCLDPAEIEQKIKDALTVVHGLDLINRSLATLSGGEKQKVAIASLLVLSPDVLILDEPTSNLDPIATRNVFTTLHHMREQQKMTVIIIEHKLTQLLPFDPQWVVMEAGQISSINSFTAFNRQTLSAIPVLESSAGKAQPQEKSEPCVTLSNIRVELGGKPILKDLNLSLYPGEFIGLMGPNGSGKTTLLRTIMGLQQPSAGTCLAFGKDLSKAKTSNLVAKIGFIFQNPDHQLFTQSVWDEATLAAKNLGLLTPEIATEAKAWLAQLGLADRSSTHPNRLSYGEKRRLNLISVILHHPRLLLIDEFLIGQDMINAHHWMALLASYAADGNTVLLVNHHPELTRTYCDRVWVMDEGRLIIDAPVTEAFHRIADRDMDDFLPEDVQVRAYA